MNQPAHLSWELEQRSDGTQLSQQRGHNGLRNPQVLKATAPWEKGRTPSCPASASKPTQDQLQQEAALQELRRLLATKQEALRQEQEAKALAAQENEAAAGGTQDWGEEKSQVVMLRQQDQLQQEAALQELRRLLTINAEPHMLGAEQGQWSGAQRRTRLRQEAHR
ncbi:hypothetical protein MDA_GLEAN10002065 [Myotis davidii]|uniref:Uncharacterized protein n=1 Tax=Myotis davidii TaxID=225400 RepID=L5LGL5_MYODS|nr:hypothetical protein MDA_GLEAN10002065 [Myotis davidii]